MNDRYVYTKSERIPGKVFCDGPLTKQVAECMLIDRLVATGMSQEQAAADVACEYVERKPRRKRFR